MQLRGTNELESTNTLRNSVLPQSMGKAPRFKLEQKGGHFTEHKNIA